MFFFLFFFRLLTAEQISKNNWNWNQSLFQCDTNPNGVKNAAKDERERRKSKPASSTGHRWQFSKQIEKNQIIKCTDERNEMKWKKNRIACSQFLIEIDFYSLRWNKRRIKRMDQKDQIKKIDGHIFFLRDRSFGITENPLQSDLAHSLVLVISARQ